MESIFLELLQFSWQSRSFCIFGGAIRDYLIGKPISDIDVFVVSDFDNIISRSKFNRKAEIIADFYVVHSLQTVYSIACFLRVVLNCTDISVQCMNVYPGYHFRVFFRKDQLSSHIDIIRRISIDQEYDFNINTLYFENGELKTLVPRITVRQILYELGSNVAKKTNRYVPEKRIIKMKNKGFYLNDDTGDIRHSLRMLNLTKKIFTHTEIPPGYEVTGETKTFYKIREIFQEIFKRSLTNFFGSAISSRISPSFFSFLFYPTNLEVYGKSVEDLQEQLKIPITRKGNVLYHKHGTITFCRKKKYVHKYDDPVKFFESFLMNSLLYFPIENTISNPDFTRQNYLRIDFKSQDLILTIETLTIVKDNIVSALPPELRLIIYQYLLQ